MLDITCSYFGHQILFARKHVWNKSQSLTSSQKLIIILGRNWYLVFRIHHQKLWDLWECPPQAMRIWVGPQNYGYYIMIYHNIYIPIHKPHINWSTPWPCSASMLGLRAAAAAAAAVMMMPVALQAHPQSLQRRRRRLRTIPPVVCGGTNCNLWK